MNQAYHRYTTMAFNIPEMWSTGSLEPKGFRNKAYGPYPPSRTLAECLFGSAGRLRRMLAGWPSWLDDYVAAALLLYAWQATRHDVARSHPYSIAAWATALA